MRSTFGAGAAGGRRLLVAVGLLTLALWSSPAGARTDLDIPPGFGRGPQSIYCIREPYIFTHNAGLLTLQVTNIGVIGNPFIDELSAGWRGGEYLYVAALWIGAIGEDADPHVSTGAYQLELRPSLLPVDVIYRSYEGIKGGLRKNAQSDGDDDSDFVIDEDFQNGKDDDGDGRIDEDYAAVGQQMFSCEYWDNSPEAINQVADHRPLGIKIRQRSFQWTTAGINEFVGFDFNIVNIGDQRLRNVYIGFFVDADAGPKDHTRYWTDDLVGFARIDSTVNNPNKVGECAREKLSMDIAYVWDAPDNGTSIVGGDVPGYFGGMFLGHTTDATGAKAPTRVGLTTVKWTSQSGAYPQGDPRTDFERYDLLSKGEIPRRNAFKPDDYRFTLVAGPFAELSPGDNLSFQTAFVLGEGFAGMVQNAIGAQRIFNGQYVDADHKPTTGIDGEETCLIVPPGSPPGSEVLWNDPCDTLNIINEKTRSSTDCIWVDDDCNTCTGAGGAEFHINWVGTTAPPPPASNTDPALQTQRVTDPSFELYVTPPGKDRKVVLQWDNVSELRPDPITGKDLFEGYRVWRVDNWHRPEGSIGPNPEQWMLVAEFRKHPRDGLGVLSPRSLRQVEHLERNKVKAGSEPNKPQYYIGRYEWADTNGVTNGKIYFYGITAFGVDTLKNPATGVREVIELGGSPAAVQKEVVVASWDYGNTCDEIGVVPNPYRGGADWDLLPSDCDPTGTKVAFRNLPVNWTKLSIFSLTGDLVLSVGPSDSRVLGGCEVSQGNKKNGTFYWDLISRSGQNVVAGVYLYVVEHPGQLCRGRFVIIR